MGIKLGEHKHFAVEKVSIQTCEDMNSVKPKEDRSTNVKWVLNGISNCSATQNIFEKFVRVITRSKPNSSRTLTFFIHNSY